MDSKGNAEWKGDLKGGRGTFSAGDGGITGEYSFKSRFEREGPGSTPEELIATAHASCFSMALSNMLATDGHVPDSVQTGAVVSLERTDDGPTITRIALTTVGVVPGLDEAGFKEYAEKAKAGCPVSRALAAVSEITVDASLGG